MGARVWVSKPIANTSLKQPGYTTDFAQTNPFRLM